MNRKLPPRMTRREKRNKAGRKKIYYYAQVINAAGKRGKVALGQDFEEACSKLRSLESELDSTDRVYSGDTLLKDWAKLYLELVKNKRSLERDRRSIKHLTRVSAAGDRLLPPTLRKITRASTMIYRNKRTDEGVKDSTINRELKCLQHMLNLAQGEGLVPTVPKITFKKEDKFKRDRIYSDEEYCALLAAAPRDLQRCLIGYWETGMRKNELLKLTWPLVDRAGKVIRLPIELTKEDFPKVVPITPALDEVLAELEEQYKELPNLERRVFTQSAGKGRRKGRPMASIKTAWERCVVAAGIANAWIHDFRHTFITRMEAEGYPTGLIMKITGHRTFHQHRDYLNLREGQVLRAFFNRQNENLLRTQSIESAQKPTKIQ